jgi:hypothetical protein
MALYRPAMMNLMRASARTRVTFVYEAYPYASPFGPTALPSFKFAPSEFSRQKSPKPFALPCMDAQMPRRQDGEERPTHNPAGSLRSSLPAARKELAIVDRSDTFSLVPQSTAVLGVVQSQLAPFRAFSQ